MNELVVTCKVIEDLMPLYADGICSEDTKTVVEHHTAECPECRKKLADMTAELGNKGEKQSPQENPFKKVRRHYAKLVIVTLCICAAVMIPSAVLFRMYINEQTNQGISFSTVAAWKELHRLGSMLKRGEYLEVLNSMKLMYEEEYTAEEVAAFKKAMAEDMEACFEKYPIKKVKIHAEEGRNNGGEINLFLDKGDEKNWGYTIQCSYDGFSVTGIGAFDFFGNLSELDYLDYEEISYSLPCLSLIPKNMAETLFKGFVENNKENLTTWHFLTDERRAVGGEPGIYAETKEFEILRVYDKKIWTMLKKYDCLECKGGAVTYESGGESGRFLQQTVLTMQSEESGKFTVSFDLPIISYGNSFTYLENVSYSDNAPEDFKVMFEDIFVSREPVWEQYEIPHLNDGKFYLNGNTESCYFKIENDTIQLVVKDEKQAKELYAEDYYPKGFEVWSDVMLSIYATPKKFKLVETFSATYMPYEAGYNEDGTLTYASSFARYIDSDNICIANEGILFTRVETE